MNDWLQTILAERTRLDWPLFGHHAVEPNWHNVRAGLPEHLVYFVESGTCAGRAGDEAVRLGPGSLLWLSPGVPFDLALTQPDQPITLLRFRLRVVAPPEVPPQVPAIVVLHDAWPLRGTLERIIAELTVPRPMRDGCLRALAAVLFTDILRLADRKAQAGLTLTPGQCGRLVRYIHEHIADRPTPADLAALLQLSPDYFARQFRRTFGLSPRAWLVRERIRRAALRLDESADTIGQVADAMGYPDVFLFSRQFKQVMGRSPRAYRAG